MLRRLAICCLMLCWPLLAGSCSCDDGLLVGLTTGDGIRSDGTTGDGPGDDQTGHFDAFASDGKKLDTTHGDAARPLPLPVCRRVCKTSADCCASPPCDSGRNAMACQAGLCRRVGCKSDADCVVAGAKIGTCKQIKDSSYGESYGLCGSWCAKDGDCQAPDRCVARLLASGDRLCGTPCTKDGDCLAALICVEGKFCGKKEQRPCASDAHCSAYAGLQRCYLKLGRCYCDGDANCQTALGPLHGGSWKCR